MDKLKGFIREIGPGGWLLPVAVIVCFVATIGGLFLQPAASPGVKFGFFDLRCWVDPCFVTRPPRWQRLGPELPPLNRPAALAVGPDGTIVVADESGMVIAGTLTDGDWQRLRPELPPLDRPAALAVGPDGTIVVADESGMVIAGTLTDGDWQRLGPELPPLDRPAALAVGPDGTIVVADESGMVIAGTLTDGDWQRLRPGPLLIDRPAALAVGPDGTIVVADESGMVIAGTLTDGDWQRLRPGPLLIDRPAALAVGPDGTIVVADESGMVIAGTLTDGDWQRLRPGPLLIDRPAALAVGPDGTIVVADESGTIYSAKFPTRIPAIWTMIPLVFATIGLLRCVQTFPQAWHILTEPGQNVPGIESDRPVEDSAQATTAMRRVADQIVRFVRHPDASVPLTIAITGKWGTGKSSLMNLVKHGLYKDHCPCVFFNAWHHQNETHLFASLMESIRQSAVPRSFYARLEFRTNLAKLRWRKSSWIVVFLQVMFLLLAMVLLPLLQTRWNPLKAFGVKPSSLIRTSTAWIQFPRFRDRLSFRHQFGRAFGEVCKAFANHRLAIIIDDLDRCRPEQVVEILEAVNFLTSNGECVILLGIDESQVKRAVGLHYREIAEEMAREHPHNNRSVTDEDEGRDGEMSVSRKYDARQSYADHYLEKLVNLRIRVPIPNHQDLHTLRGAGQS